MNLFPFSVKQRQSAECCQTPHVKPNVSLVCWHKARQGRGCQGKKKKERKSEGEDEKRRTHRSWRTGELEKHRAGQRREGASSLSGQKGGKGKEQGGGRGGEKRAKCFIAWGACDTERERQPNGGPLWAALTVNLLQPSQQLWEQVHWENGWLAAWVSGAGEGVPVR